MLASIATTVLIGFIALLLSSLIAPPKIGGLLFGYNNQISL
jgi:hypothetical protein